jgi:hypothetical protein
MVLLSGCATSSTSTPPATAVQPSVNARNSTTTIPEQHPLPATIPNDVTLHKDVEITACHATTGGWEASGTATDPGSSPVTYDITVVFTTPRATVLDYATTSVTVQPGATARWTARQEFATVAGMLCVLRGVS